MYIMNLFSNTHTNMIKRGSIVIVNTPTGRYVAKNWIGDTFPVPHGWHCRLDGKPVQDVVITEPEHTIYINPCGLGGGGKGKKQGGNPKLSGKDVAFVRKLVNTVDGSTSKLKTTTRRKKSKGGLRTAASRANTVAPQGMIGAPSSMGDPLASALARSTIPHIGTRFAGAMIDPFHSIAHGSYVPKAGGQPTQKINLRVSFQMKCGTGGVGWVALLPNMNQLRDVVQYTTATYASAGFTRLNTAVTGVASAKLPYPYALTDSSIQYRIVSMGVRMKALGNMTTRQGVAFALHHPDNEDLSLPAALDETSISSYAHHKRYIISDINPTMEVVCHGRTDTEFTLQDPVNRPYQYVQGVPYGQQAAGTANFYDYTAALASSSPGCPAILYVTGANAGSSYDCQLSMHVEYGGRAVNFLATATPGDDRALSQAVSIAHVVSESHANEQEHSTRADHAPSAVAEVASNALPVAAKFMERSNDPDVKLAGEFLGAVSSAVPKKMMARGFDEMGRGMSHMFSHHRR